MMNKIYIFVTLILCFGFSYGQRITIKPTDNPKTINPDAKEVLWVLKDSELKGLMVKAEELKSCDKQVEILEAIADSSQSIIVEKNKIIELKDKEIKMLDERTTACEQLTSDYKKQYKKQKRHKIFSLIGGGIAVILVFILK